MAALLLPPLSSVSPPVSSSAARSSSLCGFLLPTPSPPSSANRLQNVQRSLSSGSLYGLTPAVPCSIYGKRKLTTRASSATDGADPSNADASMEGAEGSASVESLPLETKLQLKLEQKLRMKLAKKIRLRRKRLVRKRRMRKKGRWPPAKMKKNKNV